MVDKIDNAFQGPVLSAYDRWRMEIKSEGKEEGIELGLQQGLQKGLEQGKEEQIRTTFKNMHEAGIALTSIAEFLAISEEKANELLKELTQ